jgi:hypothetical protein
MKTESLNEQEHLFFLATDNVFIHVNRPYRIQDQMIETTNFVPDASIIRSFHELNESGFDCYNFLRLPKGEMLMPPIDPEHRKTSAPSSCLESPFLLADDDEDDDDEDWDEEDEDWDEEDEDDDWDDEDDEDWDDEDDDWDDEEDEDWDDEEGEE